MFDRKFNSPHNLCFKCTTCFGTNAKNGRFAQSLHMCLQCVDVSLRNVCYKVGKKACTSKHARRRRKRGTTRRQSKEALVRGGEMEAEQLEFMYKKEILRQSTHRHAYMVRSRRTYTSANVLSYRFNPTKNVY